MQRTQLASLIAGICLAIDAQAMTLLDAFNAAQAYDSQLASARGARDAAYEKSTQGFAGLLPTVSATANINRISTHLTTTGIDRTIDYTQEVYQLQLRQPIYNRNNFELYEQSKLQVNAGEIQFEQARNDLALRVAQAYFDVLAAQDVISFLAAQKTAITEQLESAKRNFEVGTATITDTHEAQARFDLALAQEIAANNDLEVKRNALAVITGQVPPELRSLRSGVKLTSPEPSSMDKWVQSAEAGNFSVIVQGLLVDIAKLEISRNRAGHFPTLDGVATQSQRKDLTFTSPTTNTTSAVGLQLTIPLFAGFSTTSKIREAISLENQARANLDTAKRAAMQNARAAYLGVQSGLSQIRALEAAEVSSNSALESNKLGYDVGVRINIDVLNAQQQLYSTRRDLAKARYDTLINGLRLKAAAGTLGEVDLAELNALLDIR
ncbi:MAG: TolC family outer membrane protein [Sulfuritalea sp.]|jgi:outer membrane protein|nr:TolC family outer membrane protein [Polynucleobacter sp.]MCF8188930.1 TolC family outer membrane protein [Sulfuritalea sp.]